MVRVPGSLVALLTFPGFLMHEFAHLLLCKLCKLPVADVNYFDVDASGDTAFGYVRHQRTRNLGHQLLVTIGPALLGLPLGAAIALPAYLSPGVPPILAPALKWLGLSLMMHAFPSIDDALSFRAVAIAPTTPGPLRCLSRPVVWLLYLLAFLSGNLLGLGCSALVMELVQLHYGH